MFGRKHGNISQSRFSRGRLYELVVQDPKTRPERASRGLVVVSHAQFVSPNGCGNLCRLTKSYRRATNDRGKWIDYVGCACNPTLSISDHGKPPQAVRSELPLHRPEELVNI